MGIEAIARVGMDDRHVDGALVERAGAIHSDTRPTAVVTHTHLVTGVDQPTVQIRALQTRTTEDQDLHVSTLRMTAVRVKGLWSHAFTEDRFVRRRDDEA